MEKFSSSARVRKNFSFSLLPLTRLHCAEGFIRARKFHDAKLRLMPERTVNTAVNSHPSSQLSWNEREVLLRSYEFDRRSLSGKNFKHLSAAESGKNQRQEDENFHSQTSARISHSFENSSFWKKENFQLVESLLASARGWASRVFQLPLPSFPFFFIRCSRKHIKTIWLIIFSMFNTLSSSTVRLSMRTLHCRSSDGLRELCIV